MSHSSRPAHERRVPQRRQHPPAPHSINSSNPAARTSARAPSSATAALADLGPRCGMSGCGMPVRAAGCWVARLWSARRWSLLLAAEPPVRGRARWRARWLEIAAPEDSRCSSSLALPGAAPYAAFPAAFPVKERGSERSADWSLVQKRHAAPQMRPFPAVYRRAVDALVPKRRLLVAVVLETARRPRGNGPSQSVRRLRCDAIRAQPLRGRAPSRSRSIGSVSAASVLRSTSVPASQGSASACQSRPAAKTRSERSEPRPSAPSASMFCKPCLGGTPHTSSMRQPEGTKN